MTARPLSASRKADRAKMAAALAAHLREAGATVTVEPESEPYNARRVGVSATVACGERSARISVAIDGDMPHFFMGTWNAGGDAGNRAAFSDAMGADTLNRYHFGKATRTSYDIEQLAERLAVDISLLLTGVGFSPEREAANAAKWAKA